MKIINGNESVNEIIMAIMASASINNISCM
jgi:hypothetical protein